MTTENQQSMTASKRCLLIVLLALGACNSSPPASAPAPATVTTQAQQPSEVVAEAPEPEPDPEPVPTTIRLSADPVEQRPTVRIAPGQTPLQLYARVYDAEFQLLELPVQWHSLSPELVEVDGLGRLTAIGPLGPAFVTATVGDLMADQMSIYVVDARAFPAADPEEPSVGAHREAGEDEGSAPEAQAEPADAAEGSADEPEEGPP